MYWEYQACTYAAGQRDWIAQQSSPAPQWPNRAMAVELDDPA